MMIDWKNPPAPGQQLTDRRPGPGRPRGVRNKPSSAQERMEELRSLGLDCDPIRVLMEIAIGKKMVQRPGSTGKDPNDYDLVPVIGEYDKHGNPMDVDAATRAKAASELCSYLYPKRKAIEVTGSEGQPINFAVMADLSPLPGETPAGLPAGDAPLALPDGPTIDAEETELSES